MKRIEIVRQWMAEGLILHPLERTPNSIDLIRTLATLCGYREFKETHWIKSLKRDLLARSNRSRRPEHYLFILIDGLGMNLSGHYPPGGFFATYFTRELRAVFPSTTACAVTSLVTGEWPGVHGLTGWFTYLPDRERTVVVLPFVERGTEKPLGELNITMSSIVTSRSLFSQLECAVRTFLPHHLKRGEYSRWAHGSSEVVGYRTISSGLAAAADYLREAEGPTFSFFYIPDMDTAQHEQGTAGVRVKRLVRNLDAALLDLRAQLGDEVCMVVTADHGLVDVPSGRQFHLSEEDPLLRYLVAPPAGEAAMPVFHVREGLEKKFEEFFTSSYGALMQLISIPDAEALGLFGADGISPVMRARLGNFIGIASEPVALEYLASGQESKNHLAFHGGLQPEVMQVPLFLA